MMHFKEIFLLKVSKPKDLKDFYLNWKSLSLKLPTFKSSKNKLLELYYVENSNIFRILRTKHKILIFYIEIYNIFNQL